MRALKVTWPPASTEDDPGLLLLVAIVEQARRDAERSTAAAAWLASVASGETAELQVGAEQLADDGRRRFILEDVLPLAIAAGWPGRLRRGAASEIAELLGVHPFSVRNALSRLRRLEGVPLATAAD